MSFQKKFAIDYKIVLFGISTQVKQKYYSKTKFNLLVHLHHLRGGLRVDVMHLPLAFFELIQNILNDFFELAEAVNVRLEDLVNVKGQLLDVVGAGPRANRNRFVRY